MNEEQKELFFDLLTKKAIYGLEEAEQKQLDSLDMGSQVDELHSLELTAAAISMVGLEADEAMPTHLFDKIAADAGAYFSSPAKAEPDIIDTPAPIFGRDDVFEEKPSSSWFSWLGWGLAAAACIALAVNIAMTRFQPVEQAKVTPTDIPKILTPAQMRDEMLRSNPNMIKAAWGAGNVKDLKDIGGEIVWSDEKQAGYMTFRGLPKNDVSKETYQLWLFDKTQDKATPIDGGTFDVTAVGEVVIPINAKLKAQDPEMFAITIEKPGGVVVSKREKVAALAKVETKTG